MTESATARKAPIAFDATGTPYIASNPDTYPLSMPPEAAYGWGAHFARTLGAPFGMAYVAALTLHAGRGIKTAPGERTRPTLYSLSLAKSGLGKSEVASRIRASLFYMQQQGNNPKKWADHVHTTLPASDQGLITEFNDNVGDRGESLPATLYIDEAAALFGKAGIKNSTLLNALNTLYYEDEIGIATKQTHKKKEDERPPRAYAILSINGGLTVESPVEFQEMLGASTLNGFFNRLVLVPAPARWDWDWTWQPTKLEWPYADKNDIHSPYLPGSTTVTIPNWVHAKLSDWVRNAPDGPDRGRVAEIGKRVMLISASINNDSTITEECFEAGLAFAKWQERVRAVYSPSKGDTPQAILTGLILEAFQRHDQKTNGEWAWWTDLQRPNNWNRKYGAPVVKQVREGLVASGDLEMENGGFDAERGWQKVPYPRYRYMRKEEETGIKARKQVIDAKKAAKEANS